jgi:hypothetical protein
VFEGFIHPALAWGALLAGVPLLIHLLNRQRHKPIRWAAMQFVLAAYRKTRRRAQLENLILLLLRMAAVALLALAVSRPFTGERSPLTPFTESRRDVVLILDASASTGYRESVSSVFESIIERARTILGDLDGTRGDRVRLFLGARATQLLSFRSPEEALAMLTTLSAPTDESFDLAAAINAVATYAEEDAGSVGQSALEVRLLSDMQRNTFLPSDALSAADQPGDDARNTPPLVRALDRLEELGATVVVEDLGPVPLQPPNLGLEQLAPLEEILGPGLTSDISVGVRNFGAQGRAAVRVALEVDGIRQPSQKIDIGARSSAEVSFPFSFRDSGYHSLVATLEGDRLAIDDRLAAVFNVPPPVRCLLVNGDPANEVERDELGYVTAILEPPDDDAFASGSGGLYAPFLIDEVTANAFSADENLSLYDVILLADVASLSPRLVERMEERVAAGASLIFTMGDHSSAPSSQASLNARLWRADGTGLLPVRLSRKVAVRSRREAYYRVNWFDENHPALSFFADELWRPFLTEVPIFEFVSTEVGQDDRPDAPKVHILASLDDEMKSPLLIERAYARGRVFLWTTSIDDDWTRIPEVAATLVPLVHELFRYAGRESLAPRNVPIGTSIALEVHDFPRSPMLIPPGGTRRRLDGEPHQLAQGLWSLPAIENLDRTGLWQVELEGGRKLPFAAQFDVFEGDLERISAEELETSHPVWRSHRTSDDGEDLGNESEGARGELWRFLAAAVLLVLILETLWAAWIGHGRRFVR